MHRFVVGGIAARRRQQRDVIATVAVEIADRDGFGRRAGRVRDRGSNNDVVSALRFVVVAVVAALVAPSGLPQLTVAATRDKTTPRANHRDIAIAAPPELGSAVQYGEMRHSG